MSLKWGFQGLSSIVAVACPSPIWNLTYLSLPPPHHPRHLSSLHFLQPGGSAAAAFLSAASRGKSIETSPHTLHADKKEATALLLDQMKCGSGPSQWHKQRGGGGVSIDSTSTCWSWEWGHCHCSSFGSAASDGQDWFTTGFCMQEELAESQSRHSLPLLMGKLLPLCCIWQDQRQHSIGGLSVVVSSGQDWLSDDFCRQEEPAGSLWSASTFFLTLIQTQKGMCVGNSLQLFPNSPCRIPNSPRGGGESYIYYYVDNDDKLKNFQRFLQRALYSGWILQTHGNWSPKATLWPWSNSWLGHISVLKWLEVAWKCMVGSNQLFCPYCRPNPEVAVLTADGCF